MPGGQKLPNAIPYSQGDIAIVVRGRHIAYGVVGDAGPSSKIGEASPALLWQLDTMGPVDLSREPPAMTILLPGTRDLLQKVWPIDPADVETQARKLLVKLGIKDLNACGGLARLK
jgi:hypothetical protein